MAKLTESYIKALPVTGKRYSKSQNGLAIEVLPSGKKTFVTWQAGRKFTIGRWPELSLREAREALVKLKLEIMDTGAIKPSMTLQQFLQGPYATKALPQRKRGDESLKRIMHVFVRKYPLIADRPLRKITPEDVAALKVSLENDYAPATVKRELGELRTLLNTAVKWGYIQRSPAADVKDPKVDRYGAKLYMSDDEVERLRQALEDWKTKGLRYELGFEPRDVGKGFYGNAHPLWFYVCVKLLMNTGLRKGEMLALKWGDVNFQDKEITVRGATAKSGQTRRIPISKKLMVDLYDWYVQAHSEELKAEEELLEITDPDELSEFVPPNPDEPLWPVKSIPKPWERLKKMAKMGKEFTPHLLRHHFASTLVKRGRPLNQVQALLGHKDIATTQIYLSVRQEDLAEAVDLL